MSGWTELDKVAVYICTTDGPVRIERISNERAALSEVFVGRGVTAVLPMSDEYGEFVRDHRPIARAFGPFPHQAFRMDIERPIQSGQSWQLAVFIAHGLAVESRLAGPEDRPALALFLTGTVDADFRVGSVGHLSEKRATLQELKSKMEADDVDCALFAPAHDVRTERISDFQPIESAKDLMMRLAKSDHAKEKRSAGAIPSNRINVTVMCLALLSALLLVLVAVEFSPFPAKTAPIVIAELKPPANKTCAAVQFERVAPVVEPLTFDTDGKVYSRLMDVCAIRISGDLKEKHQLTLSPDVGRFVRTEYTDERVGEPIVYSVKDSFDLDFNVPRFLPNGLSYRLDLERDGEQTTFFHIISR